MIDESALQALIDRQAIYDVLLRYCRGVDRLDRDLILSCYHPDATDDHGIFLGNREEFVAWVIPLLTTYQTSCQHQITNHSCDLDGDTAHCETYYLFAGMNSSGPPLTVCGGRYVDRLERRDGIWAIAARLCFLEWEGSPAEINFQRQQNAADLTGRLPRRDKDDPSYARPLQIKATVPAFRIVA